MKRQVRVFMDFLLQTFLRKGLVGCGLARMNGVALSFSRDASICQQGTCVSNAPTGLLKKNQLAASKVLTTTTE
jgi:hypothetical protein